MRTIVALLVFSGCRHDDLPQFVTEHLQVTTYDEDVLCRGTLDRLEAQVVRVASFLDVGVPHDFRLHYGPSAVDRFCSGSASGCAWGPADGTEIAGDDGSVMHELVHGVRSVNDVVGVRFFEEGLAEVLGGTAPTPYAVELDPMSVEVGPVALSAVEGGNFDDEYYPVAAHFMSWLLLDLDADGARSFLTAAAYADSDTSAFDSSLGISLGEAETLWREGAASSYAWGTVCDGDIAWAGAEAEVAGRLDCSEASTFGPVGGKMDSRCSYLITPAGDLEVEFNAIAGEARITNAQECEPTGGVTPEHHQSKSVAAGERVVLPFAACRWRVYVQSDDLESMDYRLAIRVPG